MVEQALKVELPRNAHQAGIDRAIIRDDTATPAIYKALGLHPIKVTA
ncbi:hypothetical protein ACWD5Q_35270 [Streptomyces sp. NPDC002513]